MAHSRTSKPSVVLGITMVLVSRAWAEVPTKPAQPPTGCASMTFVEGPGSPISVDRMPFSVALSDLSGDGTLDLAVTSLQYGSVAILIGDGKGGFGRGPQSHVSVGDYPASMNVADLNGDGTLDMVIGNRFSPSVSVLLGKGAGEFLQADGSPIAVPFEVNAVAIGDLDGNKKPDVVAASGWSGRLSIFVGDGRGGFAPALGSPVVVGTYPYDLALGDWNGDEKLDVVVSKGNTTSLSILLASGSGKLAQAPAPSDAPGKQAFSVVSGDWNGDGTLDLAETLSDAAALSILLGDGKGGFVHAAGSPVSIGSEPRHLVVGDVNGDSFPDLITSHGAEPGLSILINDGAGGFSQAPGSPVPAESAVSAAVGDLNGDGALDVALVNIGADSVRILLRDCVSNTCTGPMRPPPEVDSSLRVVRSGSTVALSWDLPEKGARSSVVRGCLGSPPAGKGPGKEECLASGLDASTVLDASLPAPGTGYWYLVRADNGCGQGPYGFQTADGAAIPYTIAACK